MHSFYYLLLLIFSVWYPSLAQTGIGTSTPHHSAQLEVASTDKGVLIPRMTLEEKLMIDNPAQGLLIFQIDGAPPGFYYFDGTSWVPLEPASSSGIGGIVPLATGYSVEMNYGVNMELVKGASVGFGSAVSFEFIPGEPIPVEVVQDNGLIGFTIGTDGELNAITCYVNFIIDTKTSDEHTVHAMLYRAEDGSSFFNPIPESQLTFTYLPISPGTSYFEDYVVNLQIPVFANDRFMMIFYPKEEGVTNQVSVTAGGGISIK